MLVNGQPTSAAKATVFHVAAASPTFHSSLRQPKVAPPPVEWMSFLEDSAEL